MKRFGFILILGLLFVATIHAAQVGLIKINGPIGPATANYITRALEVAADQNDECLIIQLDTPGGLLQSTKEIVENFYSSAIPTVVYVSPSGASAASAGTFVTMAADIATMAPFTRIGAAHPVGMNGEGETNGVIWTKIENDSASSIRNIAE
jgi:membrane-bound serine protease (ClpP class)